MNFSNRSTLAVAAAVSALVAVPASSLAQQPEPLRLTPPAAHVLHFEPLAQAQSAPAPQSEPVPTTAPRPQAEPLAQAEPRTQGEPRMQTAQGELLDVNAKANTLTVKTPTSDMTFTINNGTKFTGAPKGISALATMTGSQVIVMFRKEGAANTATAIEVRK